MLQRDGKPTMLGRAIGEFGHIYKTQYLLTYLDDPGYRRRILTQLNRGKSQHSLARAVFMEKEESCINPTAKGRKINWTL